MSKMDGDEAPIDDSGSPGHFSTDEVEPGGGDPALGAIAARLLVGEGHASLTVFVGGRVITGRAVSPSRWYAAAADDIASTGGGDAAQMLVDVLRDMGEGAGGVEAQRREYVQAGGVDARPRALHFLDAFLQDGPGAAPLSIGDWRIQFDRIDGWRLGGAERVPAQGLSDDR